MKTKITLLIAVALFFTVATQAQGYNGHAYGYNQNHRDFRYERVGHYWGGPRINYVPYEVAPVYRPRYFVDRDARYECRDRDYGFHGRRGRY